MNAFDAFLVNHPVWTTLIALYAVIECLGLGWAWKKTEEQPFLWRVVLTFLWPVTWLIDTLFIVQ